MIVTVSESDPQPLDTVPVTVPELLAGKVIEEPVIPFDQVTDVPGEAMAVSVMGSPAQALTDAGAMLTEGGRQKAPE